MSKKHILVVDDDNDILFLIAHSIKRLSPDLEVSTAKDGASALEMLKAHPFELVLTDHMMPEVTGVMLATYIRQHYPQTRVMLMTAYDTNHLTADPSVPPLDAIIPKPFQIRDLLKTAQTLLADLPVPVSAEPDTLPPAAVAALQTLWEDSNVDVVLLLNADGHPLHAIGDTDTGVLKRLASFVADNFLAVTEFSSLLGDHSASFQSSYHQGSSFNIYAHQIDGTYLLAVVFAANRKPGPIWVYTRKTAEALAGILPPLL